MSAQHGKVPIDRLNVRHTCQLLSCGGSPSGRIVPFDAAQVFDEFQGINPFVCPDLSVNVSTLEDAFLLVGPGQDGVVFDREGNLIRETCNYSHFSEAEYTLQKLKEKATYISQPMFSAFDSSWRNYYHWTILGLGKAMLYNKYSNHRFPSIIYDPKDRGDFIWPLGFSDNVWHESLRQSLVLKNSIVLKRGIFRISTLDLMWISDRNGQSVDQPPFITYFPEFYNNFNDNCVLPRNDGANIIIARRHDPRLSQVASEAMNRLCEFENFVPVALEDLDFGDQLKTFRHAKFVVAPHGAGLANLVYMPASATIVELNQSLNGEKKLRPWFYLIAATKGQNYSYLNMDTFSGGPRDIYNRIVELLHI